MGETESAGLPPREVRVLSRPDSGGVQSSCTLANVSPTVLLEHGQLPDLDSQPELLFHSPQRGMEQQELSLTKSSLQKHFVNVCCVPGLVWHWEDRGE